MRDWVLVGRLVAPDDTMTARMLRYGAVGLIAFAIDFGVTAWLFRAMDAPLLVANTVGFLIANVANFLLGHWWVFRDRRDSRRWMRAYAATLAVSIVGLLLNDAMVWISVAVVDWPLLIGKVSATAVVMLFNFFARHHWVYRPTRLDLERKS